MIKFNNDDLYNKFVNANPNICLYYSDYRDEFESNTIQKIFDTGYYNEDWIFDSNYESICYMITETFTDEEQKYYYNNEDLRLKIEEYCYEKDTSNPVKDIAKNTGKKQFYYFTGKEIGESAEEVSEVITSLGIDLSTDHNKVTFKEIQGWNFYGGRIEILFQTDDLYYWIQLAFEGNTGMITIENPCIGIADRSQGSGGFANFKGKITLPFSIVNISVENEGPGYSLGEVYGDRLLGDSGNVTVDTSTKPENIELDTAKETYAQWDRDLKEGICSWSDPRYSSHTTEYINDYPCGHKCKKCGKFFID